MAPRTRSCKGLDRGEAQAQSDAIAAGLVNNRGLPALPSELLLEIMAYFRSVPVPCIGMTHYPFPPEYRERSASLQILSQLCQSLRRVLLPLTWDRIEVCSSESSKRWKTMKGPGGKEYFPWEKTMATEIVKQLEIVTVRNPSLGTYIQAISVFITRFSSETVPTELARCLALFPNLHTLQLSSPAVELISDIAAAFAGHEYPSIRTLTISSHHHKLLESVPKVKNLYIMGVHTGWYLYDRIHRIGLELESLRGDLSLQSLDEIVKIPSLKVVQLPLVYRHTKLSEINIALLSGLPNLISIELRTEMARDEALKAAYIPPLVSAAKKVLAKGSKMIDGRRSVKVFTVDNELLFDNLHV